MIIILAFIYNGMDLWSNQILNGGFEGSEHLGGGGQGEEQGTGGQRFRTHPAGAGWQLSRYSLFHSGKSSFLRVVRNEAEL